MDEEVVDEHTASGCRLTKCFMKKSDEVGRGG